MLTLFLVICELEFLFIYFLCYFSEEFDLRGNKLLYVWVCVCVCVYVFLLYDHNVFQGLVTFFGTLSRDWELECMKDILLVNLRGNLQIIVQVLFLDNVAIRFMFYLIFWISQFIYKGILLVHDLHTTKEYFEQVGVDACIKLFEQFKSYEGL